MSRPDTTDNIALVGFMGCGKSSVGRFVAGRLGYEFVDTDELVERGAGRPISTIFAEQGEEAFRELEREVLTSLAGRHKMLISTGGGLITYKDNLALLKDIAVVVCLWAGPETIWSRVSRQTHRPLLNGDNPRETIKRLLGEREPFYRQADILVNTDRRSMKQVGMQVIHQFRLFGN